MISKFEYGTDAVEHKEYHPMADITEKLDALIGNKLDKAIAEKLDKLDWQRQPRRLLDGTVFPLGDGRGTKIGDNRAPAYIRQRGESGYSLLRVFRSLTERDKSLAPAEWDIHAKLAQAGFQPAFGGIMVPLSGGDMLWRAPGYEEALNSLATEIKQMFPFAPPDPDELARVAHKAMTPLDDTEGGSLIPFPAQGQPIQLLHPNPVVEQAGARIVPLPTQGSIFYPKETADAVFHFIAPNSDIQDSTPATGGVSLQARRAGGVVKLSNELLRFSPGVAETMIRTGLVKRASLTEDLAFLEGTGGGQPLGIVNWPRSSNNAPTADKITLHTAGTTGGTGDTLIPEDIQKMMALVEEAPDPDGATAWIMRPLMFAGLANLRADGGGGVGTGPFLFPITRGNLGAAILKEMAGLPVLTSTQISKSRTKGGSGAALTYVLCGDFHQCLLGRFGTIELAMSVDAGFAADQTWLRAITRFDIALAHPEAFVITDQLVIPA
jgi:HK97 family phage major capsid protein